MGPFGGQGGVFFQGCFVKMGAFGGEGGVSAFWGVKALANKDLQKVDNYFFLDKSAGCGKIFLQQRLANFMPNTDDINVFNKASHDISTEPNQRAPGRL